jgi:hypothetical protein
MRAFAALAQFPDPQPVTQKGAPFGQIRGHHLTAGQRHLSGGKLLLAPILAGEFVTAQAGDALLFHAPQKVRRIVSELFTTPWG